MSIHTEGQLINKRMAIRVAAAKFAEDLKKGSLQDDALLHYEIECLNQLVQEFKRG